MPRRLSKKSTNRKVKKSPSNKKVCHVNLAFTQDTINYFKSIPHSKKTRNKDGTYSQKETAGGMYVGEILPDSTHLLEVHHNSVITGEEEGVDIVVSLYNFHSHPYEAYINNHVNLAWPSAQDYIGFLIAVFEDCTICHFVVTLEGIYIISLTEYYAKNKNIKDKNIGDFILNNFEVYDYLSPKQYV